MRPRYSRPREENRVGGWVGGTLGTSRQPRLENGLSPRPTPSLISGERGVTNFFLFSPRLQLHHCLQASSHSDNFSVLTWCSTEYVGCYKDSDPRDLPQRLHDREVTVSSCVKNCKDLFYRYAGIQFSYLCFCGNKRGRYGQLPEWKCSSECASKKDEHCGGYWSNSIYKTGAVGKRKSIASLNFRLSSSRKLPRETLSWVCDSIQAKHSPNLKGSHLVFISGERKLRSCKLIVENLFWGGDLDYRKGI